MNEELYVTGFSGSGTIEIYSIIGNKINEIKVKDLQDFKMSVPLEKGNMYIIRVLTTEKNSYSKDYCFFLIPKDKLLSRTIVWCFFGHSYVVRMTFSHSRRGNGHKLCVGF